MNSAFLRLYQRQLAAMEWASSRGPQRGPLLQLMSTKGTQLKFFLVFFFLLLRRRTKKWKHVLVRACALGEWRWIWPRVFLELHKSPSLSGSWWKRSELLGLQMRTRPPWTSHSLVIFREIDSLMINFRDLLYKYFHNFNFLFFYLCL